MQASWLLLLSLVSAPNPAPDVAVVCPAVFREALQPWLDYRAGQGHVCHLIDGSLSAEEIQRQIRKSARRGALRAIVLVGDAVPASKGSTKLRGSTVPTFLAEARVNIHWGSEPEIAADNAYADLDDDQVPDVAIGRLPVHSPGELSDLVQKILDYEQTDDAGTWRRQINFVAGLGGFGTLADLALEGAAKTIIGQGVPAPYSTSMTYANWESPYCPLPLDFHDTTLDRLNEGCLFWVYIGHGARTHVDHLRAPDGFHSILSAEDVDKLDSQHGSPVALFLACYTGAFDGAEDCLAERMLRVQGGPVAVLAGSRVTMPYGMGVLGIEMLKECFVHRAPTLGELMLNAKRNTVLKPRDDPGSQSLDAVAMLLNPKGSSLLDERREHLLLFNLLGDPLTRLAHPHEVELTVPESALAGGSLSIRGQSPLDGEATVELVVRRDRLTFRPAARTEWRATAEASADFADVYRRANDARLASVRVPVRSGAFSLDLDIPERAWGDCHVRVFVQGHDDQEREACAIGASDLVIRRAAKSDASARKLATPSAEPKP